MTSDHFSESYEKAWCEAREDVQKIRDILNSVKQDQRVPLDLVADLNHMHSLVRTLFNHAFSAKIDLEKAAEKYHTMIEEMEAKRDE